MSVICPFFNEETIVVDAVQGMCETLASFDMEAELIIVNDGSTDRGLHVLNEVLTTYTPPVSARLLSYSQNRGRGHALRAGIKEARGDIIVTTELDLSWGDDIVERLVKTLNENPEVHFVIASPHKTGGGFRCVPRSRILLSSIGNRLLSAALGLGITMHTGMTRAYRREVIQPLHTVHDEKDFHLEVLLKLLSIGFRSMEISATISWAFRNERRGERLIGKTKIPFKTIGSHLVFLSVSRPVRYFGLLALTSVIGAVSFFMIAMLRLWIGDVAIYMALMAAFMSLFSLVFFGFSIIFAQFSNILRSQWADSYKLKGEEANSFAKDLTQKATDAS